MPRDWKSLKVEWYTWLAGVWTCSGTQTNFPVSCPIKLALSPSYGCNSLQRHELQYHKWQPDTYGRCGAHAVSPAEEHTISLCQRWSTLLYLAGNYGSLGGHNLAQLGWQAGWTALTQTQTQTWFIQRKVIQIQNISGHQYIKWTYVQWKGKVVTVTALLYLPKTKGESPLQPAATSQWRPFRSSAYNGALLT